MNLFSEKNLSKKEIKLLRETTVEKPEVLACFFRNTLNYRMVYYVYEIVNKNICCVFVDNLDVPEFSEFGSILLEDIQNKEYTLRLPNDRPFSQKASKYLIDKRSA